MESARAVCWSPASRELERVYCMRSDAGKSVDCCSLDGKPRALAISTDSLAQPTFYLVDPGSV